MSKETTPTPFYRRHLQTEFERRKLENPSYSMRAFARDLGMDPSKMSRCLKGTVGISATRAKQLAEKMSLGKLETELFVVSAEAEHARNRAARVLAQEKLGELLEGDFNEINLEKFTLIRDWYHFAILELSDLEQFQSDVSWIARALEIPESAAREAVERLDRLDLLDRSESHWRQTQKDLETPHDFASRAARDYHRQMSTLMQSRLERVPLEKREVASSVFAIDTDLIPEAKKLLRVFHRELTALIERSQRKNGLYSVHLQLMPLFDGDSGS